MKYTFGFIGTGNMGGALARAASKSVDGDQIVLANRSPEKAQVLADRIGCQVSDNEEAARESRFLFLGVKPHLMANLLKTLRPILSARKTPPILVSMAAGLKISQIDEMAGVRCPILRIMPNTPVSVGSGVILYEKNDLVKEGDLSKFIAVMSGAGELAHLDESLMDAGSAVSGCGPAFAFLFIDALADGGVACGLSRGNAIAYAAQTMIGAAQMILETGKHPDELKNEVCSPGGSTIQGVRVLEEHAVRAAAMNAVIAAYEKTKALGQV
ncbi:MAG: pyrroline-5-carboxylate reductase [Evtepia sp.]